MSDDDVESRDEHERRDGPLFSFDDDESSSLPHWSEPATGEMPVIDTSTTPGPQRGGSRLFPQLPDDPNMVDEGEGPTTGVFAPIDDAPLTPGAPPVDEPHPTGPTGIDLGGSLAGGIDEPAPTGPLDDVYRPDPGDGDLPAPRWGAAAGAAPEGFIGDVDPEALARVRGEMLPEFSAPDDEFVGGDLSDLDDLIAEADEPGPRPTTRPAAPAEPSVAEPPAPDLDPLHHLGPSSPGPSSPGPASADPAASDPWAPDRGSPGPGAPGAPPLGPPAEAPPSFAPAGAASDPQPAAATPRGVRSDEDIDAWSALDDPAPLWREGAQDYETDRRSDDAAERTVLHMPADDGSEPPVSAGRNMPVAIGVGVTLAVAFLLLVDRGPGYALIMVVPLLVLATSEFFLSVRRVGYRPATLLGLATVAGLPLATHWKGVGAIPLVLVLATVFGLLWYLFGVEPDRPTANVSVTLLGVLWVGLLGSYIPLVLQMPNGSGILLGAIIGTVTYDVAGLFIGRATGQSRLAPSISPNKTYEGLIGGMIMSILVVTFGLGLAPGLAPWDLNQVDALLLGIVVAVIAPLGDLAQSLVKRDLGIKDMGTALPGHGGVFDRFDALLLVIPAVYYLAMARDLHLLG